MLLLHVAKVSEYGFPTAPANYCTGWWPFGRLASILGFLGFKWQLSLWRLYNPSSTSSYSTFTRWIKNDPITADGNNLVSYKQVELVILGFGLAFRAIWIVQFPDQYRDVPAYIINSCYPFMEYDQLSHCINDLLSGCGEMYVQTSDCLTLLISIFPQPLRNTNGLSTQDTTTAHINLKAYISGHRKQAQWCCRSGWETFGCIGWRWVCRLTKGLIFACILTI